MSLVLRMFFPGALNAASELAAQFAVDCPMTARGVRSAAELQVQAALDRVCDELRNYKVKNHPGIIHRAFLVKALQDDLVSRGYSQELVTKIITAITAKALVN